MVTNVKKFRGEIRKPKVSDVEGIKRLIDNAVKKGALLPRTSAELYENLRDFHVYVMDESVYGCCALHIDTGDLAEIRSLVVSDELQGQGIGAALIESCIQEALSLDIAKVYALTRVPEFFAKQGFYEIDKHTLPNKVFRDCVRCPMFPDCDETAMLRVLRPKDENTQE